MTQATYSASIGGPGSDYADLAALEIPRYVTNPQDKNDAAAIRAAHVLAFYKELSGASPIDPPGETVVILTDLLADLRHMAEALGLDFEFSDERAVVVYEWEREGLI
ncbi:hypothetical protein SEA_JOURNEY13_73 [Mycobacterium phage Journey13]|nr:hypothetical protein SEA_JOURNEY13_73 [Mycobacterium phage Journey13]